MRAGFSTAADGVLRRAAEHHDGMPGVPGVVAMVTDRNANLYEGAAGKRDLDRDQTMTTDSVVCIFSCTKAVTGAAVMQLVENGTIGLDDPAKTYVPEIAKVHVLEGFDASGEPRLRVPKSDITVGQLLLHTAGFGYDFFNADLNRYSKRRNVPNVVTGTMAALESALLFDPGTRWEYGCNVDWAGRVVENARGERLSQSMRRYIFEPLDMNDTGFTISPAMRPRRATIHQRAGDGALRSKPHVELPQAPQVEMGGHGLYATAGDYMKFIRMILNDGAGPNGRRVLKPETVTRMATNALGALTIRRLPGVLPNVSHDVDFFPGTRKSWGYTWLITEERAPTGRPAGTLGWGGLANIYYWIDRPNGIGGLWATQIFPFIDPVSMPAYLRFETTVYDYLN